MYKLFLALSLVLLALVTSGTYCLAQEAQAAPIMVDINQPYQIPADLNEDERYWFVKFQEGNLFADGWQDIAGSILAKTPAAERLKQKALLDELGEKIGLEWCRENAVRKIDTSMLKSWGKQLKNAAKEDPANLGVVLAEIDKEVSTILD